MTLHEKIIAEAPLGISERECPGAFNAIIAKDGDGVRVNYIGRNDNPRHREAIRADYQRWLDARKAAEGVAS